VFWRRLVASPPAIHDSGDAAARVTEVLRHIALLVADEPEFACAVTNALLGKDPDVEVLRQRIGRDIRDRLSAALGPTIDPDIVDSLEMLYSGALVRAGMGYASYAEIAQRLEKSARLILS
jgi:TetR/AcrR family transcriptional regulator, cholesterol catabolism regulator